MLRIMRLSELQIVRFYKTYPVVPSFHKMVKHGLKILQEMLQDF